MNDAYERHLDWVKQRREKLGLALLEILPDPTDLALEIGCGHGHWLVEYAKANPGAKCLGIDIVSDRVDRANRKKVRAGLSNIDFLKAEAMETLDQLPEWVNLSSIFLLFPDPWPKKRHWKNRLFSDTFLKQLGQRVETGVRLHFRTDHLGYYEWAKEVVESQTTWQPMALDAWPLEAETVFQQKADAYQSLILVKEEE